MKFCKHLFFFCRFASRVHVHSAQTGTGGPNWRFGDSREHSIWRQIVWNGLARCCMCLVQDTDSNYQFSLKDDLLLGSWVTLPIRINIKIHLRLFNRCDKESTFVYSIDLKSELDFFLVALTVPYYLSKYLVILPSRN